MRYPIWLLLPLAVLWHVVRWVEPWVLSYAPEPTLARLYGDAWWTDPFHQMCVDLQMGNAAAVLGVIIWQVWVGTREHCKKEVAKCQSS